MMLDGDDGRRPGHAAQGFAHGEERGGIMQDERIGIAVRGGPLLNGALAVGVDAAFLRKCGGRDA